MDPASALGVGAGALQIFDFSVKIVLSSINLLRSLRDVPKQIIELSQDVDKSITRLLDLEQRLRQSDEPLVQKTSAAQLGRLQAVVSGSHDAIQHLHGTLQRVGSVSTDSWGKKKWKAVVSVHLEQDIERHLRRIQRQDSELQRQLQLAGLDINVDQSQKLADLGSVVDRTSLETQSTNANIQSLARAVASNHSAYRSNFENLKDIYESKTDDIIKEQSATKDAVNHHTFATVPRLDLLHLQGQAMQNMISGVSQTTTEIIKGQAATRHAIDHHALAATPRLDLLHAQGQATQDKISGVSEAANLMRSELQSLRNEMLSIITQGKTTISTQSQKAAGRLTTEQNAKLNQEISKALSASPQALQQASDIWSSQTNLYDTLFEPKSCNCIHKTKKWSTYKGAFGARHDSLESHNPQCRFRAIGSRSWRYSLSVQLLPFLRKTVELTFGASFQDGEFAMARPLRVWNTVKRSESPMFRLFDDFSVHCGKSGPLEFPVSLFKPDTREVVDYKWDMRLVEYRLHFMCQQILDLSTTGVCPWRIRDEYGNTLLHVNHLKAATLR